MVNLFETIKTFGKLTLGAGSMALASCFPMENPHYVVIAGTSSAEIIGNEGCQKAFLQAQCDVIALPDGTINDVSSAIDPRHHQSPFSAGQVDLVVVPLGRINDLKYFDPQKDGSAKVVVGRLVRLTGNLKTAYPNADICLFEPTPEWGDSDPDLKIRQTEFFSEEKIIFESDPRVTVVETKSAFNDPIAWKDQTHGSQPTWIKLLQKCGDQISQK